MPTDQLLLFIAAGWLLNLTPGPDVLYIVSHALRSGARAGMVAGLGITAGCFVHIFAAALGVGALLSASAIAFDALKWAGAAYLFYTGTRLLFSRSANMPLVVDAPAVSTAAATPSNATAAANAPAPAAAAASATATPAPVAADGWRVFKGGFLTNVLNPKVALFFLAFVPQFIGPDSEHPTLAFLALGVLFNLNAIPVNMGWALAAAWLARRATAVGRGMLWLDRCAGALFIGFGLKLAFTDHPA